MSENEAVRRLLKEYNTVEDARKYVQGRGVDAIPSKAQYCVTLWCFSRCTIRVPRVVDFRFYSAQWGRITSNLVVYWIGYRSYVSSYDL